MFAIALALTAGCAPAYPEGLVRHAADAATLAKHKCSDGAVSFNQPWHASLIGHAWSVSFGDPATAAILVTVDARTGAVGRCRVYSGSVPR